MFSKKNSLSFFLIILIVSLSVFTRFYNLNWGSNHHFQPDENNMASALSRLQIDNLDPKFYAYGQFPLYLGFFTLKLFNLPSSFSDSILILRFYSALFSILSVGLIYLLSQKIFSLKVSIVAAILTIFNPGLIQIAHFGTTESLLILIFLIEIYLSILIYQKKDNYWQYILAGIFGGIGIATKISSLIFLGPIFLVSLMKFISKEKILSLFFKIFILISFVINFYLISSPYNFVKNQEFFSSMKYETSVATGQLPVFYTTQFKNTSPYLFQIQKIFPYSSGIFQFILAFFGLILLLKNWKLKEAKYLYWFIILIPSLVYFFYFGQIYAKWTRFVSPLFFLFPLLSTFFISSLKSKIYRLISIFLALLPGLYFMKLYFISDTRLIASQWIENNIPQNSKILSEGGNVVDIPITDKNYQVINYDFYGDNYPKELSNHLFTINYIIVPSRRVFKNYDLKYHQHLFDGSLGYEEISKISPSYDLFLNAENAEETWSVFDHPTIRVFEKVKELTVKEYEALL
jgi:hypothetical protein